MDVPNLAVILHAALSPNPDERKAAEHTLDEIQHAPQHLVRLLQIVVDNNCDIAVRQVASIQFKNYVAKYWFHASRDVQPKISPADMDVVRNNILNFITQVPPLLRVQLAECLKTIVQSDYPKHWPHLLNWVKHNLKNEQVYGALFVLQILARKYEFMSEGERTPLYRIVGETFPQLLIIFNGMLQINNPSIEIAELIKLICKIFWSSTYMEIPNQLLDPNVMGAWIVLFVNLLERSVPVGGQPTDPELRKSWGWWKVKKWTVQILNRLYIRFGDLKLRNPKNKAFAQMFQNNYAGKILECYLKQLNMVRVGGYLPDRVVNLILQYLSKSISRNTINNMLQPQLDVILFEIVFPIICFNDNDQRLWVDDPHEYVRKGYDIIEDLYSPRAASLDFVNELMRKRGQENLLRFIQFIVEVFKRYEESPPQYKPYFQKDGALLAIGSICEILKQTEPYKSELEHMLVKHVFPEFSSPVGHLRAKAAWVVGQYANINYSDPKNHRQAFHSVISGMRDHELPVRVDSVFALRSFIEASKDLNEIHAIMPQLLDELFKLMDETENEDLVFTLEIIVDKFGEEISPYALGLCQHLAAAVWKCIKTPEADNVGDEFGALAATGYLRAIGTILESVSQLPRLFMQIEPILLPIMRKMLTTGQEVYEETLDIVSYMTLYSPTISIDMWSLWPLMIEALEDWAIDFFPNILAPLDNYVSRGTAHFLTCVEPNYQMSLWNMISSILENKNLDDSDIKPAPKLIQVVFQNCKGQIDQWVEPYIRITVERLRRTELPYLKCLLMQVIADSLYYNASLTIGILSKLGVAAEIFNLWFQMLQQVKKSGARANFKREQQKKVCCLGLTSLIAIPGKQLPVDAAGHVLRATLDLLMAYKDQLAEAAKEEAEADYDGMDVFQTDDGEEEDSYESNKEMGIDADKENEANNIQVRKLAAEAKFFRLQDEDTDDSDYDDNSDNDEVQTPIDEVDAFVFFVDSLKAVQASDPLRFQSLMQSLDAHYQGLCNEIAQDAEQRRAEIQKQCMEKGAPATDT